MIGNSVKRAARGLGLASAVATVLVFTGTVPSYAADHHGGGGIGTGAAVGIGLGSFALGTAVGSAAAAPYYGGYPYGGYYAPPAPAYYPAAPYYAPRSCWDPYYRRYYAC